MTHLCKHLVSTSYITMFMNVDSKMNSFSHHLRVTHQKCIALFCANAYLQKAQGDLTFTPGILVQIQGRYAYTELLANQIVIPLDQECTLAFFGVEACVSLRNDDRGQVLLHAHRYCQWFH